MYKNEALAKLENIIPTDDPWYLNRNISWKNAYDIVKGAIEKRENVDIGEVLNKRVVQVLVNKKNKVCPNCAHILN